MKMWAIGLVIAAAAHCASAQSLGGSNGQYQFNNSGSFGGTTNIYYANLVCDGSTDNTTAFAAAISTAENSGNFGSGARLVLPAGVCVSGPQTISGQITIEGAASGATVVDLKSGSTSSMFTVQMTGSGPASGSPFGIVAFEHLSITSQDGKGGPGGSTVHGIVAIKGTWRPGIVLQQIEIFEMPADGFNMDVYNSTVFDGYVSSFETNFFNNGRYGAWCNSASDWTMVNAQFGVNVSGNLVMSGCDNMMFTNADIYSAQSGPSLYVYGGSDAQFVDGSIDANNQDGVYFTAESSSSGVVRFIGTRFTGNGVSSGTWYDIDAHDGTGTTLGFTCDHCRWGALSGNDTLNVHFGYTGFQARITGTAPTELVTNAPQNIDWGAVQRPNSPTNVLWGTDFNLNPWQVGTSFTGIASTLAYTADGWFAWGGGSSSISVSKQSGSPPQGLGAWMRFGRGNSNTAAIYTCQIIESGIAIPMQGQNVTLSLQLRAGAAFSGTTVTLMVITGTIADEGSAALNGGTWTAETSQTTAVTPTTNFTQFTYVPANSLGTTVKEIAICISYTPSGSIFANDYVEFDDVQLEVGNEATLFQEPTAADTIRMAQRYFECSYDVGTVPGTVTDAGDDYILLLMTSATFTGPNGHSVQFKVTKFKDVTPTVYSSNSGASGKIYDAANGVDVTAYTFAAGKQSFGWYATPSAANTQMQLRTQWCASARL